jgi:hypothetical protein
MTDVEGRSAGTSALKVGNSEALTFVYSQEYSIRETLREPESAISQGWYTTASTRSPGTSRFWAGLYYTYSSNSVFILPRLATGSRRR